VRHQVLEIVEERGPLCINQSVALVKPKTSHVHPVYLLSYMLSSPVQGVFKGMSKGNAMAHLQITELSRLPIPLPSLQLQRSFAARVSEIDKLRAPHRAHLAKLDALFASLQHRAFRGEL
jgi:type I restriction enzyme, S subunit